MKTGTANDNVASAIFKYCRTNPLKELDERPEVPYQLFEEVGYEWITAYIKRVN